MDPTPAVALAGARLPAPPRPRPSRTAAVHARSTKGDADLPGQAIPHTVPVDDPHASHHPDDRDAAAHLHALCALFGQFGADPGEPGRKLTP